ncbi:MAG: DUF1122 family protein [Desulfurococcales archaeon]|nr:DUF1122 family protein [Desulfurococcales archaeon]
MNGTGVGSLVRALVRGVRTGWLELRGNAQRGRFPEETNIVVSACSPGCCEELFTVKAFRGRPPYYRPWIEIYNVEATPSCGPGFGGPVEDLIIGLASRALGAGGRLFVEYIWDPVTVWELESGVPPRFSRLGFKLFTHGFTWLKDWYYPEGFMEGSQKLQGEKPASPRDLRRHLEEAADEAMRVLREWGREPSLSRAETFLRILGYLK